VWRLKSPATLIGSLGRSFIFFVWLVSHSPIPRLPLHKKFSAYVIQHTSNHIWIWFLVLWLATCHGVQLAGECTVYQKSQVECRIWGSHGSEHEDGCLLGCSAV
jgi:hypothetical protein